MIYRDTLQGVRDALVAHGAPASMIEEIDRVLHSEILPQPISYDTLMDGLEIGQEVMFTRDIDIQPQIVIPAGATGTIVAFGGDEIGVLLHSETLRNRLDMWLGIFWLEEWRAQFDPDGIEAPITKFF